MRTVIVCDWIPPAFGAVGQYMLRRAEARARSGEKAVLIGLGDQASRETRPVGAGELAIVRVPARKLAKSSSLPARAAWALAMNSRLARAARRAVKAAGREPCEIVVTGSPPFLAYLLIVLNALFWRRTLVYRITDFYPETVFAAGHLRWLAPMAGLFHRLRRLATRIEALGEDQVRRLVETGVPGDRIGIVRDDCPIADWSVRALWPRPFPDDKLVLLYSGNLGVAHELGAFCEAYRRHVRQGSDVVRLWANASGARLAELRDFCAAHDLPLHISPPVDLADLPAVLKACDAHLVLLGGPFWGYVLPSKIYACLELDQPIFYVGPAESDVHLLAAQSGRLYFHAAAGDAEACLAQLEALAELAPRRSAVQSGGA
jgi:colanic acid biosynthesis glycosyl transferase WcaI